MVVIFSQVVPAFQIDHVIHDSQRRRGPTYLSLEDDEDQNFGGLLLTA
jgi:hypothetical protein